MTLTNLLQNLPAAPDAAAQEVFETLLRRPGLRIERIVSHGQASPPDFWYCQPQAEWVAVLSGSAGLRFADEDAPRVLRAGDFVEIPAGCRHRVDWTDAAEPTIWLAIHYGPDSPHQ